MERLTDKYSDGTPFIPNHIKQMYGEGKIAEKLAYYENLEENGRLVKLPCKDGYIIHEEHVDYVELSSTRIDYPEIIHTYKGICELDKLPFLIDINENAVEEFVLQTFREAHEKVLELKMSR